MKKWSIDKAAGLCLAAMGLVGVVGILHACFSIPQTAAMLVSAFLLCGAACLVFLLKKQKRRILLLCLLCAWVIFGLVCWEQLRDGAILLVRLVTPHLMRVLRYDTAAVQLPASAVQGSYLWFGIYALVPYAFGMVHAVAVRKSAVLGLLLTVPSFAFGYAVTNTSPDVYMALLFAFWAAVLLQARFPKGEKKQRFPVRAVSLAVCAAVFAALFAVFPQESYTPSLGTIAFRNQIKETATEVGYALSGGMGSPIANPNGETSLDAAGSILLTDNPVLRVRAAEPQDIYLRGYAASEYTGHAWLQADPSAFEESGAGIEPMEYLEQDGRGSAYFEGIRSQIRVEPVRAGSRWLFSPYQIAQVQTEAEWVGDAYLAADGQESYLFEVYGDGEEKFVITGNGYGASNWLMRNISDNGNRQAGTLEFEGYEIPYISTAQGIWIMAFRAEEALPDDVIQRAYAYLTALPDDEDDLSLFYPQDNADAAYLRYIREEYTRLPDGLQEQLAAWWEEQTGMAANGNTPYYNWTAMAGMVADVVRESGAYSTNPGQQPVNRDFVEYFLTESNKGYCVHFASATVAMLRALGVPARYAEGYVVRESDFDESGVAEVPARRAHAWAEIWVPDFGWVPVESTPGGDAVPLGSAASAENGGADAPGTVEDEGEDPGEDAETPGESAQASDPADLDPTAGSGEGAGALWWILPICAAAGVGALFLIPAARRAKRSRILRHADRRQAVLCLYDSLCELSLYDGEAVPQAAMELAREARFSRHPIAPQKVRWLENQTKEKRKKIMAALPWRRKLSLLWKGL